MAQLPAYPITRSVPAMILGARALRQLPELLQVRRGHDSKRVAFIIDHYFERTWPIDGFSMETGDEVFFADTTSEPTTDGVDELTEQLRERFSRCLPSAIVGIGGGSVLDTAKAVSNLLTNNGRAQDYQGWDLVRVPGVYKIGIPTLSGTGAELSRTCVMLNHAKNVKLGMNSGHSIFDLLILDPELTRTVPREQYCYTGMDCYIHCIESLHGRHRHSMSDAYAREALRLCEEVFLHGDMRDDGAREKLMVASYLGGAAIANSFVGVVHPVSAALSVVYGVHHCEANCLALNALGEFYPAEHQMLQTILERQRVSLRGDICAQADELTLRRLYDSTIVHEKPLRNALGDNFKSVLTFDRLSDVFRSI